MRRSGRLAEVLLLGALTAACTDDPCDPRDAGRFADWAIGGEDSGSGSWTCTPPDAQPPPSDAAIADGAVSPAPDAAIADGSALPPGDAGDAAADAAVCDDCCADGFPRGSAGGALSLVADLTPSPEGVAVCPGGEVFVALDGAGEIWRVPLAGGSPERWAALGDRRTVGLTCDEHGRLFVAIFASRSGDPIPIEVMMVTGKDAQPVAMPQPSDGTPLQGLNGIVAVPGVGVYASDTLGGTLVLVRESSPGRFETRIAASELALPNGLAYRPATRELHVAASGAFRVFAFGVGQDGTLSDQREVPMRGFVLFEDGVAVDATGEVYVADYLSGVVVRASDGAAVAELQSPASLAFRGGTLFITSYDVLDQQAPGALYAVELGVCGD